VRFSEFAIGSLPTAVLLCVLTIFLLSIKNKSLSTWMLIGYFSVLSILLLSYVVRYSILSPFIFHTGQFSNLIVFGVVSYLLFAYQFQENLHPRESKVVTILFLVAALYVYVSNFFRYPVLEKIYDFKAHYYTYVFGPRISIVTGLGYFWIIVVFFRKMALTAEYSGPLTVWRQKRNSLRYIAGSILIVLAKIVHPGNRRAKSLRALALLTLGTFVVSFMYLLMSTEVISREAYGYFFNTGGLLATFAMFIVYTNYTFERSSFRWKLIGVTLAPAMVILGIAGSIIMSFLDTSFDHQRKIEVKQIESMLRARDTLDLPDHVVYITSSPMEGGFFSPASIRDMKNDRHFDSEQARALAQNKPDRQPSQALERGFRYFDLYDPDSFFIHYNIPSDIRVNEIGYRYKWYRADIHKTAVKLFYVIMGSMAIILILFPLFFYRSLFKIDLRIF